MRPDPNNGAKFARPSDTALPSPGAFLGPDFFFKVWTWGGGRPPPPPVLESGFCLLLSIFGLFQREAPSFFDLGVPPKSGLWTPGGNHQEFKKFLAFARRGR